MPPKLLALLLLGGCAAPPPAPVHRPPPSLDEKGLVWLDVHTRLRMLDPKPVLGGPIRVALDLVNAGEESFVYDDQGLSIYDSFDILGPDGRSVPHVARTGQTFGRNKILNPGQTVTLIPNLDISSKYLLRESGAYHIRFDGFFVTFVHIDEVGRREDRDEERLLRSDWLRFELGPGRPPAELEIAHRLRLIAPAGWDVECSSRAVHVSHPDASFWDKTLNVHFGEEKAEGALLGRSAWGDIRLTSTWSGLGAAWPDYPAKIRSALDLR